MTNTTAMTHTLRVFIAVLIGFASIAMFAQTDMDKRGHYSVPIWSPSSQYAIFEFRSATTGETQQLLRSNGETTQLELDVEGLVHFNNAFWETDEVFWFIASTVENSLVSFGLRKTFYSFNVSTSEVKSN
jgi:hypothetical protein